MVIWDFVRAGKVSPCFMRMRLSLIAMISISSSCSWEETPENMLDLGGEVEITLSEDGINQEKHVFSCLTTVFIKAGLYHCPLVFTKVDRPFVFYNFALTNNYKKIMQNQ